MKNRDSFYFDHDYNARNDQKILILRGQYGLEGYGLYWCLIETMASDSKGYINREAMGGLSLGYGLAKDRVLEILEFCVDIKLIKQCEHGNYTSDRVLEHKEWRKLCAKFGAKGAKKRWGHSPPNSPPNSPPMARIGEDRIVKDKKKIKKFTKPSIPQIEEYCKERNNTVNPKKFFDHYESNGWQVGKVPMRDWKASVRTWEHGEQDRPRSEWQS